MAKVLEGLSHLQRFGIYHIGNTLTETWKGYLIRPNIGPQINLIFMCFLSTFFSSLGQQHLSVVVGLLQRVILPIQSKPM